MVVITRVGHLQDQSPRELPLQCKILRMVIGGPFPTMSYNAK